MTRKIKQMAVSILTAALILNAFSGTLVHAGALDQLRRGADNFSDGKEDTDYFVPVEDAGTVLDSQIEAFTAGRENPQPMDTEQVQTIVDDAADDEIVDPSGLFSIASDDDVRRALQKMLDDTKAVYAYELAAEYIMDIDVVEQALMTVERNDPIDSICVSAFGYTDNGITGNLALDYSLPANQLRAMKQETRTLANEAVRELTYLSGQPDIKIVYEVNEYVCDKVFYPDEDWIRYPESGYSPEDHTAWSALKNGHAVCDGYARTCKLLLNELGVKCDIVYGNVGLDPDFGGHAWNLVNVENAWYHMDTCWNDGSYMRQDYFLVSDSMFSGERIWDASLYPATASFPYDYKGKI